MRSAGFAPPKLQLQSLPGCCAPYRVLRSCCLFSLAVRIDKEGNQLLAPKPIVRWTTWWKRDTMVMMTCLLYGTRRRWKNGRRTSCRIIRILPLLDTHHPTSRTVTRPLTLHPLRVGTYPERLVAPTTLSQSVNAPIPRTPWVTNLVRRRIWMSGSTMPGGMVQPQ